jgi:hypothetical protein
MPKKVNKSLFRLFAVLHGPVCRQAGFRPWITRNKPPLGLQPLWGKEGCIKIESPRADSPWLATGLASIKIKFLFGDRRFLAACCEELQFTFYWS